MRNEKLEKSIIRIDNDIESMKVAKKYLSNVEEINEVIDTLNKKRQILADELYYEDSKSYEECCKVIQEVLDKNLGESEQTELLNTIKETFGRRAPNVSKKSNGLNAWLKTLDIEYKWIESEKNDWAVLVISGFGLHQ
ncbi:hypothetical protein [Clostridium uliginosum]|uniref:Uncharacterized protein n=1 Tax=Clostridium uliginosum TaxID=119641 RepID=A0A1I1I066_9CLOT|nr:hypothetical protein [Clostridium uliginosum]SFC29425.1 hypothetical protein SAMN05421842_10269 [Clostridium uliginosum]